ncbi:MAG: hypothetical protein AAFR81_07910 [Chloroflexota bacterium]
MTKGKKKLTTASGELMQALNITPEDLAANNNGYITDHQREMLSDPNAGSHGNYYAVGCLTSLIGLGFLVVGGVFAFLSAPVTDLYLMLVMMGIFLSISVFTIVIGRRKRYALIDELERSAFSTMQGVAIVKLDENNSTVEINDIVFDPDKDVLFRIKHLEPYLVHYLPKTKTILSMEHIPDNPNLRNQARSSRLDDNMGYDDDSAQNQQSAQ